MTKITATKNLVRGGVKAPLPPSGPDLNIAQLVINFVLAVH